MDRVVKRMSLSADEFRRSIAVALKDRDYRLEDLRATLTDGPRRVAIAYKARPPRRLGGLLELPQSEVTLCFEGYQAEERDAFLRRFDIAFQRGGG